MSVWTHAKGILSVNIYGRTQAECKYIIETVLEHLPKIYGMNTYIVQEKGCNTSCTHNEFGEFIKDGWHEYQSNYFIVIDGDFRHTEFDEAYRNFMRWVTRLAKRVTVQSCVVKIWQEWGKEYIIDKDFSDMCVDFSCCGKGTVNWCEYLMWEYPRYRGKIIEGKPDFPDGGCLDFMTEKERNKRLGLNRKRGKR